MIPIQIRWMICRDMEQVLEIEGLAFPNPWSKEDFTRYLRQRNCIGMVATDDQEGKNIVGFMIYELHKTRLYITNFAVHSSCWRRGVGTAMVERLKTKISPQRRSRLVLEVRETNLAAQQFFRSQGFRAVSLLREFYEDSDEDAYMFHYRAPAAVPAERS
jgi:[ribosomal protein S18]-alanine N-acetyltransferase